MWLSSSLTQLHPTAAGALCSSPSGPVGGALGPSPVQVALGCTGYTAMELVNEGKVQQTSVWDYPQVPQKDFAKPNLLRISEKQNFCLVKTEEKSDLKIDYLQFHSCNKGPIFISQFLSCSKKRTFQAGLCAGFTGSAVWVWPPSLDRRQDLLLMVAMINTMGISKVWFCTHLEFLSWTFFSLAVLAQVNL